MDSLYVTCAIIHRNVFLYGCLFRSQIGPLDPSGILRSTQWPFGAQLHFITVSCVWMQLLLSSFSLLLL